MTTETKHVRFIAKTSDGLYGHFGVGDTESEALENLKKSGGEIRKDRITEEYKPKRGYGLFVYRFESDLPFAPSDRDANEQESDCWVGQDGSTNWLRCEGELIREDFNTKRK